MIAVDNLETIEQEQIQEVMQCWRAQDNSMRIAALEYEQSHGHAGHGLGDLDSLCELAPGEVCPACGITNVVRNYSL